MIERLVKVRNYFFMFQIFNSYFHNFPPQKVAIIKIEICQRGFHSIFINNFVSLPFLQRGQKHPVCCV